MARRFRSAGTVRRSAGPRSGRSRIRMATTSHASAQGLLRHAETRGVPGGVVAGWLGVPAQELERPGRLPALRVVGAWVRLRDELADAAVASRAARQWSLADFGLF